MQLTFTSRATTRCVPDGLLDLSCILLFRAAMMCLAHHCVNSVPRPSMYVPLFLNYAWCDPQEARQLFCELAEQGVEVAQSNCAWMTLKVHSLFPLSCLFSLLAPLKPVIRPALQTCFLF